MPINASIKKIGHMVVPDPDYGDMKLSVFPFEHKNNIQLPKAFKMWEESINHIMMHVPIAPVRAQNNHYVTIDSKFFTTDGFLRREGVHADGNFCVDPEFGSSKPKPQPKPQPMNTRRWMTRKGAERFLLSKDRLWAAKCVIEKILNN